MNESVTVRDREEASAVNCETQSSDLESEKNGREILHVLSVTIGVAEQ